MVQLVLFEKRLRDGLVEGTVRVAFRRWRRAQVVAGNRYRLGAGAGMVLVTRVSQVELAAISERDVKAAGFRSTQELMKDLARDGDVYRIEFGGVGNDPRDALREQVGDLQALATRVRRIERAEETLRAIREQPGRRAPDLAQQLGWPEVLKFKMHVRRLKELGLTISLPVGYRLSARGEAYLRATLTPAPLPEVEGSVTRAARPGRRSGRS